MHPTERRADLFEGKVELIWIELLGPRAETMPLERVDDCVQTLDLMPGGCCNHRHASECLQSLNDRRQRPVCQSFLDLNRQAVAPLLCSIDRRYAVFQHDMMRIFGKAKARQPAAMHLGPRRAMIVMTVPEQKAGKLLAGMTQAAHGGDP